MKTITKYRADDGTEFTDQDACRIYEHRAMLVRDAISALYPKPEDDGCSFANGHGFIQHDRDTFMAVRRKLLEMAQQECPHAWIDQTLADETKHHSWAGRIISESPNKALADAWYRISCTDSQFREWGQPFYALHPDRAEQVCINAQPA